MNAEEGINVNARRDDGSPCFFLYFDFVVSEF